MWLLAVEAKEEEEEEGGRKKEEGRREKTDIKSNNPHLTGAELGFPGGGAGGGGNDPTDFQHDMKLHY